jgi:hypothetical protein
VRVYELTAWGRDLEPIVIALGTWALAAPRTADQQFVSVDSAMLTIRTFFAPTPGQPEETLRIELRGRPSGVFGVRLTSSGAEVAHEPAEEPDALLVTTTEALVASFGDDDLTGLLGAGASISGDPAVVRRLLEGTRFPGSSEA